MASKKKAPGKAKLTDLKAKQDPKGGGIVVTKEVSSSSPSLFQAAVPAPIINPIGTLPIGKPSGGSSLSLTKEIGAASPSLFEG